MSNSLQPQGLQHARLPCPLLHPRVCSNSCLLSRWCHPIISSSVVPFSSCLQYFQASGSFLMSQFFTSDSQRIGASASASVLPMNIQGWFPSGLTSLISLLSKWFSRVFSSTTVRKHQFFGAQLFFGPTLTSIQAYWMALLNVSSRRNAKSRTTGPSQATRGRQVPPPTQWPLPHPFYLGHLPHTGALS